MKKINSFLIIITICISFIYLILNFNNLNLSQILIILSLVPVLFGVRIIIKTLKLEIKDGNEFIYILFVIAAQVVGSIFHVYDLVNSYDKFVHFLSGLLSSIFAVTILNNTNIKNRTTITDIIFIIMFALSIASLWEFFEFISDNLLNGDAQRVAISGVTDTMLDMIAAFTASIIFSITYSYKSKTCQ